MKLLVDTHGLLWWLDEDHRIPHSTYAQIADPENEVYVSVVSLWEIAIKRALGRLEASDRVRSDLVRHGFAELQITGDHAWAAGALPLHHRDPFDRLLIAQAQLEKLVLVTADPRLSAYGVAVLW